MTIYELDRAPHNPDTYSTLDTDFYEDGRLMPLVLDHAIDNKDPSILPPDMHESFRRLDDSAGLKERYDNFMLDTKQAGLKEVYRGKFLTSQEPEVIKAAQDHANITAWRGLTKAQRAKNMANRPWEHETTPLQTNSEGDKQ